MSSQTNGLYKNKNPAKKCFYYLWGADIANVPFILNVYADWNISNMHWKYFYYLQNIFMAFLKYITFIGYIQLIKNKTHDWKISILIEKIMF